MRSDVFQDEGPRSLWLLSPVEHRHEGPAPKLSGLVVILPARQEGAPRTIWGDEVDLEVTPMTVPQGHLDLNVLQVIDLVTCVFTAVCVQSHRYTTSFDLPVSSETNGQQVKQG